MTEGVLTNPYLTLEVAKLLSTSHEEGVIRYKNLQFTLQIETEDVTISCVGNGGSGLELDDPIIIVCEIITNFESYGIRITGLNPEQESYFKRRKHFEKVVGTDYWQMI